MRTTRPAHLFFLDLIALTRFWANINCGALINPLNAELNPIRHFPALVGARHIVHVSRVRVHNISL
jgi:hypothetical protein